MIVGLGGKVRHGPRGVRDQDLAIGGLEREPSKCTSNRLLVVSELDWKASELN